MSKYMASIIMIEKEDLEQEHKKEVLETRLKEELKAAKIVVARNCCTRTWRT